MRLFLAWCAEQGHAAVLDRHLVRSWVTDLLANGAAPATARTRQMALKRFSAWLVEEDLADADPLRDLAPPKLDTTVIERLTDDECAGLIKACQGKGFIDRRDEAIVRLMIETGMRAGEVIGLGTDDVDLARGLAVVRRGKGGKGRVVPFGPQVARSIDRYLRMRRPHRLAHTARAVAGRQRPDVRLPRPERDDEAARRAGRDQGLPSAPVAAHRRVALAGRRRLRGRPDGRRRMVEPGDAGPLHQGHRIRPRRRRIPQPEPGRPGRLAPLPYSAAIAESCW